MLDICHFKVVRFDFGLGSKTWMLLVGLEILDMMIWCNLDLIISNILWIPALVPIEYCCIL